MKKEMIIILSIIAIIVTVIVGIFIYDMVSNDVFKATIESINGSTILVIPNEAEAIRKSSDKIAIAINEVDIKNLSVGQKISVKYNGEVQETYPATVNAIKITIIK